MIREYSLHINGLPPGVTLAPDGEIDEEVLPGIEVTKLDVTDNIPANTELDLNNPTNFTIQGELVDLTQSKIRLNDISLDETELEITSPTTFMVRIAIFRSSVFTITKE